MDFDSQEEVDAVRDFLVQRRQQTRRKLDVKPRYIVALLSAVTALIGSYKAAGGTFTIPALPDRAWVEKVDKHIASEQQFESDVKDDLRRMNDRLMQQQMDQFEQWRREAQRERDTAWLAYIDGRIKELKRDPR